MLCVLDVAVGEIGVGGSSDAAPGNVTSERVELETVAKNVESTTGGAQDVGKGSCVNVRMDACSVGALVQHGSVLFTLMTGNNVTAFCCVLKISPAAVF